MLKRLLPLVLLFTLLLSACGAGQAPDSYSLTVWYAEEEALAPLLRDWTEVYNRTRGNGTLPVSLRAFPDQSQLRAALQSGSAPALVLCGHELAFTLYEEGLLRDTAFSGLVYPSWLSQRSESVGHGFYPLGFSLPLLASRDNPPATLTELFSYAAAYGRESALPFVSVDSYAPLFYQVLLNTGREFSADADKERFNPNYVNLYNAIMEAGLYHGIAANPENDTPYRLESSCMLAKRNMDGFQIVPLPGEELLARCCGLAVTVRDVRMQRALPDFLQWLYQPGRSGSPVLSAGLIPVDASSLTAENVLELSLLSLCDRPLHLPEGGSRYYVNKSAFDSDIREALELLH